MQGVCYYGLGEKFGRKTAQKMLLGISNSGQQELVFQHLGLNMDKYATKYKRGVCIVRKQKETPIEELMSEEKAQKLGKAGTIVMRNVWTVDTEIPRFNQDVRYIERFLD